MKLKYYLRGLGIGMLVTAIIFITVIIPEKQNMSDDEIKEAATKLGMVEKEQSEYENRDKLGTPTPYPENDKAPDPPQVNNDVTQTPDSGEKPSTSATSAPDSGEKPSQSATPVPTSAPTPEPTATPSIAPTSTPSPTEPAATKAPDPTKGAVNEDENGKKTVEIEVYRKMTSEQLSATLYENGLVDDASAFNRYLMTNKYASAIKMGTYNVEFGLTYGELAKLFTSR